ncbi:hypothetical protein M422DRAFT_58735 [Sphaerobolus stellatus SS14]|nr:hypothetical protein M422DRAFT_58735 [Sphaerobolus stellatus SS14]
MSQAAGLEDIWYLKQIEWSPSPESPPKAVKVITQNFNGPCSFIAICNILILRDQIHIEPPERTSVSYEYLSNLVAEHLLLRSGEADPSSALTILPATRKGMDLNPVFTSISNFRPGGEGGELKLFEFVDIKLVHGWLVDPGSAEYPVISRIEDYDTAVNTIALGDHLTKGQLVRVVEDFEGLATDIGSGWSPEERQKVEDAVVLQDFLNKTSSQLTYHGLFHLAQEGMESGELVALFRGSHLSVLYKNPDPERRGLYTLVTDHIFAQEPSVVWERLEDVEGGASTFVDSSFIRASPAGGDFAGRTAEAVRRDYDEEETADRLLARQLQEEENAQAREWQARQQQIAQEEAQRQAAVEQQRADLRQGVAQAGLSAPERTPRDKKKGCIIM